jgi:RNA polymerase-binding transcription factor DksA
MEHLTPEEIEELRAALHAEKDLLEEELADHGKKVGDDWTGTGEGFEANEAADEDVADKMEELGVNVALVEELERRYKEIKAAIARMKEGTYGLTQSGHPIDIDRLRANPAALTNVE